jgi:hypothetical protein
LKGEVQEYEPQTMSEQEMDERLDLLEHEFDVVAGSMDIITASTEKILQALDARITDAFSKLDNDSTKLKPRDA